MYEIEVNIYLTVSFTSATSENYCIRAIENSKQSQLSTLTTLVNLTPKKYKRNLIKFPLGK